MKKRHAERFEHRSQKQITSKTSLSYNRPRFFGAAVQNPIRNIPNKTDTETAGKTESFSNKPPIKPVSKPNLSRKRLSEKQDNPSGRAGGRIPLTNRTAGRAVQKVHPQSGTVLSNKQECPAENPVLRDKSFVYFFKAASAKPHSMPDVWLRTTTRRVSAPETSNVTVLTESSSISYCRTNLLSR